MKYIFLVLFPVLVVAGVLYNKFPEETGGSEQILSGNQSLEESATLLNGEYCVFDYSNYPQQKEEAESFFNFCEEKIPLVKESLNSVDSRKVKLKFVDEGFAYCSGDTISFINTWDKSQPGFLIHEGVHVIQNYGNKAGGKEWVMEGLADLIRYKLTKIQDEPGWAIGCRHNETYKTGYGCAAAFFLWMEDYCKTEDIQIPLNNMIINSAGIDATLNSLCGKNTESLWSIYKFTNPPERIYPLQ